MSHREFNAQRTMLANAMATAGDARAATMKKRRPRRNFSENAKGLTPEDRKAMQTYRTNRGSRRYYEDLDAINSGETVKPKTENEPK